MIPRDAVALESTCASVKAAFPQSKWPKDRAVRVKRDGTVLEPAGGAFDVTVAPSTQYAALQRAVNRCPRGGSVLLLPGTHEGPLVLKAGTEVYVFGRGQATLRSAVGHVLMCESASATIDGLAIRRETEKYVNSGENGVVIKGGGLRLQACDVTSAAGTCMGPRRRRC